MASVIFYWKLFCSFYSKATSLISEVMTMHFSEIRIIDIMVFKSCQKNIFDKHGAEKEKLQASIN